VPAFSAIPGTQDAGMCAYYRAPDCDAVTIADILPILSKIDYYEDEYVIGEMLVWDTGAQSAEPNNCAVVRVIVYNDGWICAWFDKTTQNQLAGSGLTYVSAQELSGYGTSLDYEDQYNGCQLKITGSTDPDCPVGTIFTIRDTDSLNGNILVHSDGASTENFNSGYTYSADIYMTNGNMVWWGRIPDNTSTPPAYNSNRLYRAIYQIWEEIKDSSNSSSKTNVGASLVYRYNLDDDSYTDVTTDFNDVDASDCQVFPSDEEINDAFYIGYSYKYNGISITMGTPGVGSGVVWEYWDGSDWLSLSVVDGTTGFTTTGEITFNPPDDWNGVNLTLGNYYWVRVRVTIASYTTTPLITQGWVYSQDGIGHTETELGVYDFEFTGANYVLLCGKLIGQSGSSSTTNNYFYNTTLPGKTIYDHAMSCGYFCSGQGGISVNLNGKLLCDPPFSTYDIYSNGYIQFDITACDNAAGTQNTVHQYTYHYYASGAGNYVATVLITS